MCKANISYILCVFMIRTINPYCTNRFVSMRSIDLFSNSVDGCIERMYQLILDVVFSLQTLHQSCQSSSDWTFLKIYYKKIRKTRWGSTLILKFHMWKHFKAYKASLFLSNHCYILFSFSLHIVINTRNESTVKKKSSYKPHARSKLNKNDKNARYFNHYINQIYLPTFFCC